MLIPRRNTESGVCPALPAKSRRRDAIFTLPALLIILFWLSAMFWLVRSEAFPGWFVRGERFSYRDVFRDGLMVMDSWMRISIQGEPAGYTHTWLDSDPAAAGRQVFSLRNQTALSLRMPDRPRVIRADANATLDDSGHLLDFSAAFFLDDLRTIVEGKAVADGRFNVVIRTGDSVREMELTLPDDVLVHLPMTGLPLGRLSPGRSVALRVLNPLTMTVEEMRASVIRRETLHLAGQDYPATLLEMSFQGMEMRAWVDAEGRVLRQETPFGLAMEVCAPSEATLPANAPALTGAVPLPLPN
jgi:hypothetical protein